MGVHGLGVGVEGHPERLGLGRRGQEDKSQSEKEQFLDKGLLNKTVWLEADVGPKRVTPTTSAKTRPPKITATRGSEPRRGNDTLQLKRGGKDLLQRGVSPQGVVDPGLAQGLHPSLDGLGTELDVADPLHSSKLRYL